MISKSILSTGPAQQADNVTAAPPLEPPFPNPEKINAAQAIPRPIAIVETEYADGSETDWHTHPRGQLVYAAAGVMTVHTGLGVWVTPPERAVWVPSGIVHRVQFKGTVRMRSAFVSEQARTNLPNDCRVIQVTPLLRELLTAAVKVPAEYDPSGPDGRLMDVILDQLADVPGTPLHLPIPDKSRADPRLSRVVERLIETPALPLSLGEWAAQVGASPRTLGRLFLRETGMSFGAWRQQVRLVKALEKLAAGTPVTTTALDLGYDSPSAFIAMFKRTLGASPGQYFKTASTSKRPVLQNGQYFKTNGRRSVA